MLAGRFDAKDLLPYWAAQVAGAIVAAVVLYVIASGQAGFTGVGGFASNGYGEASPMGYGLTVGARDRDRDDRGLPHRHSRRDLEAGARGLCRASPSALR